MEISIFNSTIGLVDSIAQFFDFYLVSLKHLASDLLGQGLSPEQDHGSRGQGMTVGGSSGLEIDQSL